MKTFVTFAVLASAIAPVLSFPALNQEALESLGKREAERQDTTLPQLVQERRERRKRSPGFDAKAQYVETTGVHAFVPPNFAAGDQRGPCPGLNALANHGYLDHSGVDTLTNIISAVNKAYGMALDLGTFLAVFGTVFDGNPLATNPGYSIGGPSPKAQNILGNALGLIGNPQGLSGSHNKYEADTSPTRGDEYLYGNAYAVQVPQFQQYYNALVEGIPAPEQYDRLYNFRVNRFKDSVNRNPYFFFSPFAGILVAPAGYSFPPAMMSNHSAEFPDGTLSRASLMSFFAISGKSGAFKYQLGHERMPENFYKRAIGDEYTIPGFLADVLEYGIKYPELLNVGGNTGKVNSFTPIDVGQLTHGAYDVSTLTKGNNLECFVFQAIMAATPDVAAGLFLDPTKGTSSLTSLLAKNVANLACPQVQKFDTTLYDKYPGVKKSGGAI